jgi:hypothetical protein
MHHQIQAPLYPRVAKPPQVGRRAEREDAEVAGDDGGALSTGSQR